jgi:hypothetical protein
MLRVVNDESYAGCRFCRQDHIPDVNFGGSWVFKRRRQYVHCPMCQRARCNIPRYNREYEQRFEHECDYLPAGTYDALC